MLQNMNYDDEDDIAVTIADVKPKRRAVHDVEPRPKEGKQPSVFQHCQLLHSQSRRIRSPLPAVASKPKTEMIVSKRVKVRDLLM